MTIEHSYREARDMIDGMLKHIFRSLQAQNAAEIERVRRQFPHADLVFPDETVVVPFPDGIAMLRASGWREEDGGEIDAYGDLSRPAEVRLGQLVKEKYHTDYYILGRYTILLVPAYADNATQISSRWRCARSIPCRTRPIRASRTRSTSF